MVNQFYDIVEGSPMIAAVKDREGLKKSSYAEEIKVVFV